MSGQLSPVIVPFFISHRGCPHRCVYCDQTSLNGNGGALPSPAEIGATVRRYRESSRRRQVEVAFYGGTFTALPTADQKALLDAVQPFIRCGEVSGIRLSTRPDALDDPCAALLAARGVTLVELGAQSLDDEVLRRTERGYGSGDIVAGVGTLRRNGLKVGLQLMQGLPGDTPERSIVSCDAALSLQPDCLRLYPTVVLQGTRLAALYAAGTYRPFALAEAVSLCKRLLLAALRRGVPVIRLGVQANDALQTGSAIVAGPYHPAFRQLVEAEICFDALSRQLDAWGGAGQVTIGCAPQAVSAVVGQKRGNLERLRQRYGGMTVDIRQMPSLHRRELLLEAAGFRRTIDMIHDVH